MILQKLQSVAFENQGDSSWFWQTNCNAKHVCNCLAYF